MMTRIVAVLAFGATGLLFAADQPNEKVQVSKTERMDFPSSGTLRLTNSIGVPTVEAWDRPDVEITAIKSIKDEYDAGEREKATRELDKVQIVPERRLYLSRVHGELVTFINSLFRVARISSTLCQRYSLRLR